VVLNSLIEGIYRIILMDNLAEHATANHFNQATLANPDPTHSDHLVILAKPLESPCNMTCKTIHAVTCNIISGVMPQNALARVKHHQQRQYLKPASMSVRSHCQCLVHINAWEPPTISPFEINQSYSNADVVDILLFTTPPEWQRKMDRMGLDPAQHSCQEVFHFLENYKAVNVGKPSSLGSYVFKH
jgi:hypothetical protein